LRFWFNSLNRTRISDWHMQYFSAFGRKLELCYRKINTWRTEIIYLHQTNQKRSVGYVKPALFDFMCSPTTYRLCIRVLYDIETFYLTHVKFVQKGNSPALVGVASAFNNGW